MGMTAAAPKEAHGRGISFNVRAEVTPGIIVVVVAAIVVVVPAGVVVVVVVLTGIVVVPVGIVVVVLGGVHSEWHDRHELPWDGCALMRGQSPGPANG
jgi:hypothetical protein